MYRGGELLLSRRNLRARTFTPRTTLPAGVDLSWRVRGSRSGQSGPWSRSCACRIVPLSSSKTLTAFSFQGLVPAAVGTVDETTYSVTVPVPFGTPLTALVATFSTTGASVAVGGVPQQSGVTANSFLSPVTYEVTAADGSTQAYVVTVTVGGASSAKALTAFSFQGLAPAVTGTIDEGAHTVSLTVPAGTSLTSLVATFVTTGAAVHVGSVVQVSGVTPNDFSAPVTYRVTAADPSTQDYVVTVTRALSGAKAITAFSFASLAPPVVATIDEPTHSISLRVPYDTDMRTIAATFTTTGVSVSIGGTPLVSGVTLRDYSSTQTLVVTAEDGTTVDYYTYVSWAPPVVAVGDTFQGGTVVLVLHPGDPGYVEGQDYILIAAPGDESAAVPWDKGVSTLIGGTSTALGAANINTFAIIDALGASGSYAAFTASRASWGGWSWYLPSKDDLAVPYANRAMLGGFSSDWYWSSSEADAGRAWMQHFGTGAVDYDGKDTACRVRAVRWGP